VSLGFFVPGWARAQYPKLDAVGRFESKMFNPETWVPEYPNPSFLNRLSDDEFWMAKQIVNMRNEEIHAIVESAQYHEAEAASWIEKCLIERRDKIGRAAFAKVLPIDKFQLNAERLEWVDVASANGLGSPLDIKVQWSTFDNERETASALSGQASPALPPMDRDGYWLATLESPSRPKQAVRVYVRKRGDSVRLVGLERTW
jgi:hypothetical protein